VAAVPLPSASLVAVGTREALLELLAAETDLARPPRWEMTLLMLLPREREGRGEVGLRRMEGAGVQWFGEALRGIGIAGRT
jgi:hypothetical protein